MACVGGGVPDGCSASAEAVPTDGVLIFKTSGSTGETDGDESVKGVQTLGCVSELFPSISRCYYRGFGLLEACGRDELEKGVCTFLSRHVKSYPGVF